MKNFRTIIKQIATNSYINRGNVCYRMCENGVKCRMDCSEFSPEDLANKIVVYYIYTNGLHYFGRTDAFDRRMSEHLRTDGNLFQYYKNSEFIVKPIMICNTIDEAIEKEREIISFAKFMLKSSTLINKNC